MMERDWPQIAVLHTVSQARIVYDRMNDVDSATIQTMSNLNSANTARGHRPLDIPNDNTTYWADFIPH